MTSPYSRLLDVMPAGVLHGFISAFIVILAITLIGTDEPRDFPLETADGVVARYEAGRGSDSIWLRTTGPEDRQLRFFPQRSALSGHWADFEGKALRFEHYGGYIANCWLGTTQVCFSKCRSDLQCKQDQDVRETRLLRWVCAVMAAIYAAVYVWAVHLRRRPS